VESEFVRQIFDLTPAEAAVTRRLTAGLSLEDAASSLDISRNTARAHLRSIFSKSGITRQTELVRLVLSSAALLGEKPQQAA
jgi:DNA-binding CsgD family transcriptional regulator